jgi:hypothetical protein
MVSLPARRLPSRRSEEVSSCWRTRVARAGLYSASRSLTEPALTRRLGHPVTIPFAMGELAQSKPSDRSIPPGCAGDVHVLDFYMSEFNSVESPSGPLVVPASVEAVIAEFDSRGDPYTCMDVESALSAARTALEAPTAQENAGAWAEVLAFGLAGTEHFEKPWGTYFGPMGSGTRADGEIVFFPDVRQADAAILNHWKSRARTTAAPVLAARYNDLVWDLSKLIADERRDVAFARAAADAYLAAAAHQNRDEFDAFADAERALALAIQISDEGRRDAARLALLELHRKAIVQGGLWWRAWDVLEGQSKSGLVEDERTALVADLEAVLAGVSDPSVPGKFDPHAVESVAHKLIAHYRRVGQGAEVQRLHLAVAKAFELFGGMASPLLSSTVLQTSMDAYNQAGMHADAERILRLIEQANVASIAEMKSYEHRETIPAEVVEEFLGKVVADTKEETFLNLAFEFLLKRAQLEDGLKATAKSSPLLAMIPQTKIQGDRIVAQLGSIDGDPTGRLIDHANRFLGLSTHWLGWAVGRAIERHALVADDFTAWANRTGLFGDGRLLHEGVAAWVGEDHIKAAHILVPQIEAGFRRLLGRCGRPTTKPNPQMPQARMVVSLSEALFHKETASALGEGGSDFVLHFQALYADPRGHNLRNDIAHGLVEAESLHPGILLWVMHSLLLLGAWLKPKEASTNDEIPPVPPGSEDAR